MNYRLNTILFSASLFVHCVLHAQSTTDAQTQKNRLSEEKRIFKIGTPDYKLSPYTGMTRKHWKDTALYLLQGAFSYINKLDDPMTFPKQPGKSYPGNPGPNPTEKLEGLCRTLFIAAPLLKENASLQINNINVADYYGHHIVKLIDSSGDTYFKPRAKNGGPSQILVEFGALAVSMFVVPEIIWEEGG